MFVLESMIGYFILAALISAVTAFGLLTAVYFILRNKGLLVLRKRKIRTVRNEGNTLPVHEDENEIPEETLVAIIAAAVAAMGEERNTRFRVVSFRRMR